MPKKDTRSWDDRNAERRGTPGRDKQVPAKDFVITLNGKPVTRTSMNFRGLKGGLPTADARELRRRAKSYDEQGASDSARAARVRAANVEGHKTVTAEELKKRYPKKGYIPGSSKPAQKRGYAKGGKIDGCAKKGHTKGKMR